LQQFDYDRTCWRSSDSMIIRDDAKCTSVPVENALNVMKGNIRRRDGKHVYNLYAQCAATISDAYAFHISQDHRAMSDIFH